MPFFLVNWPQLWQALQDFFLWIPRKIFEEAMNGLEFILTGVPVPDFILDATLRLAEATQMAWWFYLLEVNRGMEMIFAALILKFTMKFVPFWSF